MEVTGILKDEPRKETLSRRCVNQGERSGAKAARRSKWREDKHSRSNHNDSLNGVVIIIAARREELIMVEAVTEGEETDFN